MHYCEHSVTLGLLTYLVFCQNLQVMSSCKPVWWCCRCGCCGFTCLCYQGCLHCSFLKSSLFKIKMVIVVNCYKYSHCTFRFRQLFKYLPSFKIYIIELLFYIVIIAILKSWKSEIILKSQFN